ncbi:MAG: hypothetical protein EOP20_00685 [Hyphomicrobiales bacterium]|nr:MAG: hypothetical protein EOP20_00685 [Hyphomicrobiales bacterium]
MATARTATRIDAERHLSDHEVTCQATEFAFRAEALSETGLLVDRLTAARDAVLLAQQIETLAGATAAQRPAVARSLRTAAHHLRRAAETCSARDFMDAASDARDELELL